MKRAQHLFVFLGAPAMALALSIAASSTAHAERAAPNDADALFEQGKLALKQGDWTRACDYFRRSLAVDPSPSTHVKLARCHERDGEFKAASDNYSRALELLGDRSKADAHARELESLIRSAKEAVDARLGSLELVPRPPKAAMPASPANVEKPTPAQVAPPQRHEQQRASGASAARGAAATGSQLAAARAPTAAKAPIAVSERRSRAAAVSPPGDGNSQRIVAAVAGGAGIVGFGVATGLLLKARTLVDEARVGERCDASFVCNQEGKALMDKAERRQTYALVVAAGGTVLVGTGLALWLTAPAARKRTDHAALQLTLWLSPSAAYLRGQW